MNLNLELHIHSRYSFDSFMSPERIIEVAKKRGLHGIALTDHDTIRGGVETARANRDQDFAVIVGSEVNTDAGDIIGLFLNEEIKSRSWREVFDEIRAQGGVVVLPHPFRGHKLSEELIRSVDAVEVFNSRTDLEKNRLARELAVKYGKTPVAGSDAHFYSEIGLGKTLVKNPCGSELKSSLLQGDATDFNCKLSQMYLQGCSQLIKALKNGRYTSMPRLMARTLANYIFESNK